jgi:hypothetical protein
MRFIQYSCDMCFMIFYDQIILLAVKKIKQETDQILVTFAQVNLHDHMI